MKLLIFITCLLLIGGCFLYGLGDNSSNIKVTIPQRATQTTTSGEVVTAEKIGNEVIISTNSEEKNGNSF